MSRLISSTPVFLGFTVLPVQPALGDSVATDSSYFQRMRNNSSQCPVKKNLGLTRVKTARTYTKVVDCFGLTWRLAWPQPHYAHQAVNLSSSPASMHSPLCKRTTFDQVADELP
jgi:hypothetical protein